MNVQIQPLHQRTGNVGLRLKASRSVKKHFGVSLKVKRRNLSGINLKNAVSNPVSLLWAPQAPLQGNSPSQEQLDCRRTSGLKMRSSLPVLHSKLHQSTNQFKASRWFSTRFQDGSEWSSAAELDGAAAGLSPRGADRRGGPSVGGGDEGVLTSSAVAV